MWHPSSFSTPLFASAAIAIILTFFLLQRREATGAKELAFTALAAGLWAFAYGLELLSPELPSILFWAKVSYIGITTVPVGWFLFCLSFSGVLNQFYSKYLALFIIPLITVALVFSNEQHKLIWSNVSLGAYKTLENSYAPWFWVNITYGYILLASGTFILLFRLFRTPEKYRGQLIILLTGVAVPIIGNIIYITGIFRVVDLSPFGLILSFLIIAWGMSSYRLLNLIPVARSLAVEQMNEGVIVIDHKQDLLDINSAAASMLAVRAANIIGVQLKDVSKVLAEANERADQSQKVTINERVIELKSSPLRRGGYTRGQILVLFDITKQAEIEENLKQAKEAAELVKSAQNNFLANMRHELNTPLTAIIGFSELLNSEVVGPLSATQKQYLAEVLVQSNHLKELIERVLDYASLENNLTKLEVSKFELRSFLESDVIKIVKPLFNNGNSFKINIDKTLGEIKSDKGKIKKILYQLLENANKFTENGEITLTAKYLDNEFIISISDTGIGIAEKHLDHIFTSFMQLDNSQTRLYRGNGLGLALCKRYAQAINGNITVKSELGKGSTFSLHLPLAI